MVEPMTDREMQLLLNKYLEIVEDQTNVLEGIMQILHGLHHDDTAMDVFDCAEAIKEQVTNIDELFDLNEVTG